jgi:hypothetical protein
MVQLKLKKVVVFQGNGNGQSISADGKSALVTTDMADCIAILGYDGQKCYMIHSDSNATSGIGAVNMATGIRSVGMSDSCNLTISLIGGRQQLSLQNKLAKVKETLPSCKSGAMIADVSSAYITGKGVVATTRAGLATALGVDEVTWE